MPVSAGITTDSYVVQPLFFPGNISTLAVNGTVNDLAMCGARPLYLSVGLIIEEGLPMETLWRVVQSMHRAAEVAQVQFVRDTKSWIKARGRHLHQYHRDWGCLHRHIIAPQHSAGRRHSLERRCWPSCMAIMAVAKAWPSSTIEAIVLRG
jgi:hypothetical protein